MRIVIIGAGSMFARDMVADVTVSDVLAKSGTEIVLVDVDAEALEQMQQICERIAAHRMVPVVVSATTDRQQALEGADYVIMAVERSRFTLWEQDFRVPLGFGFRHVLGENGGPGAAFHALRNYEIVLPICRDMERFCPDAKLMNFTNPETRIVAAINRLTAVDVIGFCHGVLEGRARIAEYLQRPLEELKIESGGINHFFWFLKVEDAQTGENLYPRLRERVLADAPPLVRKMMEVYGHLTYPSDGHIGEYLAFAHEFTGLLWPYGLESMDESAWQYRYGRHRSKGAAGDISIEELAEPSGEIVVQAIAAMTSGQAA